jgi:hypothetical protein
MKVSNMHEVTPRMRVVLAAGGGVSYAAGGHTPAAACNVPSAAYPTIQSAVTAPACTTVKVAPGAFTENVTIARSLTLLGARAGQDARARRGGGESVVNGGTHANFTITADNVTIDGFTLNGPADQGTAALVMQTGNSGETIQHNIINNPGRAASITTSRTTFRMNVVNNTSTAGDGFQSNSTPVRDLTIAANTFSGANSAIYHADITVIEGNANVTVTGNRSNGDGTLIALFKTTGAKITDNTVVGRGDSSAIYLGGANRNVTVSDNTVSAAGTGVKLAKDAGTNAGVTISKNNLSKNQYGVNVTSQSAADTVKVTGNSIAGNALYGVFNAADSGAATTATCNWWGAITGPGAVASGRGDKVSTNVTYRPWLKLPVLAILCR